MLLGADPLADVPDADLARRALAGARTVIAVDTFLTDSAAAADVVLAAAAYGEKSGTTTNLEGRVTTIGKKVSVAGTSRPDWMIAAELAELLDLHDVADELGLGRRHHRRHRRDRPGVRRSDPCRAARRRRDGVLAVPAADAASFPAPSARAPDRISYDYRLVVARTLYDKAVGTTRSPSLAPLVGDAAAHIHPLDLERVGVAAGTEVRLVAPRGTVVLPLVPDAGVRRGSIAAPYNAHGTSIGEIIDITAPAVDVRVERL